MHYIAPIHIAPTKPLNPNHVRHLLYTDAAYKLLKFIKPDTKYFYNRLDMDVSGQVIRFGDYMAKNYDDHIDYTSKTDVWVGNKYVESYEKGSDLKPSKVSEIKKELERNLKGYKFYTAVLKSWEDQHKRLYIHNPGFRSPQKYDLSPKAVIKRLKQKDCILDETELGGGIFLDCTEKGVNLKLIIQEDYYNYNYVLGILRNILTKLKAKDTIIFIFDREMVSDYILISKILEKFEISSVLSFTPRVAIEGEQKSSRKGGFEDYILQKILDRYKDRSQQVVALGLRLYFFSCFKGKKINSFNYSLLDRFIDKSQFLMNSTVETPSCTKEELKSFLDKFYRSDGYINPIKITNRLFMKKTNPNLKKGVINLLLQTQ